MKFLKQVDANLQDGNFKATMFNDRTTDSYDAACFFMMAMDEDWDMKQIKAMISAGRMMDSTKPWDEIERLIA